MIGIKNVKHSEFASHETNCFECSVYWEGKKVGYAENSGQGGETDIHFTDKDAQTQAEAWEKEQPKIVTDMPKPSFQRERGDEGEFFSYRFTLEGHIDQLVVEFLEQRDMRRKLKKNLVVIDDTCGHGEAFMWDLAKGRIPSELYDRVLEVQPTLKNPKCLNLMPIEAACEIWGAP